MTVRMLIVACVFLLACDITGGISRDEVARAISPDGEVEAILVETNGGATTSFGYLVHVVPQGGSPTDSSETAHLYGAVRSAGAYGVDLKWVSPNHLAIEFLSARSAELKQPSLLVGGRDVSVRLVSGVTNTNAPSGGMLYNLKGQPHDR